MKQSKLTGLSLQNENVKKYATIFYKEGITPAEISKILCHLTKLRSFTNPGDYFTVDEYREKENISVPTVKQRMKNKKVEFVKKGKYIFIKKS